MSWVFPPLPVHQKYLKGVTTLLPDPVYWNLYSLKTLSKKKKNYLPSNLKILAKWTQSCTILCYLKSESDVDWLLWFFKKWYISFIQVFNEALKLNHILTSESTFQKSIIYNFIHVCCLLDDIRYKTSTHLPEQCCLWRFSKTLFPRRPRAVPGAW